MAYPLVVSLQQTLEPLLDYSVPSKFQISTNSELLKVIYEHLRYVKSFFEKVISLEDSNNIEEVGREIKDVLQSSQDLIESHISDLFHSRPEASISGFYPELVKVNAKLASFVEELKAKEDCLTGDQQLPANKKRVGAADVAASSIIDFGRNNQVIVGMEDEEVMLMDRLTGDPWSRKVISIVGMGGIGKTTLAKQVYLHPLIVEHFDVRLFVKIGVEYELEELLLRLLGQALYFMERKEMAAGELGENLCKLLMGRRYLVVLDDVWDIEVWDELRRFFPDNSNGSAIILTTRIADMARSVSDADYIIEKRFLDDVESWELLRKMALSEMKEVRSPELENVERTIVRKSGGLPLAIVMIGRLLSSSERTVESWMTVAQNLHSLIEESTIPAFLSLSYTQLPQHLKACFLYLGLFPPNSKISTSLLIRLWVAEGFIEGNDVGNKSLEEKAKGYLRDLVSRSLIIIDELRSSGGIKTCSVHGILQDLCVSEARHQNFFHIVNNGTASFRQSTKHHRRLGIYIDDTLGFEDSDSDVRSLVFICPQSRQQPIKVNLGFRWLRVLHALSITFWMFPDEVVKLVRLRYLAITYDWELPSSISRLRNLEFLIIHRSQSIKSYVFLPLEIWELQKLRHLECMGFDLPDPSDADATAHGNVLYLRKLATLLGVSARSCTEGVLARTPNLIKLGIQFELLGRSFELLCFDAFFTCLQRLESFKCAVPVMNRGLGSRHVFQLHGFPAGLRKLTLSGCGFVWGEHMTFISRLPNLQVLKLRWRAFSGRAWVANEYRFWGLKWLVLEDLDLVRWEVYDIPFPRLEQLHIRRCYNLTGIPGDIGDIPTLQLIVVDACGESVIDSARLIREEQEEYGNEDLQIQIMNLADSEHHVNCHRLEIFKCAVMNRGLVSQNAFLFQGFPDGLRKLTLSGCGFVWGEHMTFISLLPNLQVLKLRWRAFSGRAWVANEDGFVRLKWLVLEDLDIERWEADDSHFPVLEQLHIRRCYNLTEIPSGIGEIVTLQVILLDECSGSLIESARRIQEEQEEQGNESLQIPIHSSSDGVAKITNSYDATSITFAQSTAETSHSNENTFARTPASDNEVTPAGPAQPLPKDAYYEIPLKTISQLQGDEESGQFWVYATISSLKNIGASAYLACELCFAELKPGEFFCDKCNTTDIRGRMRYYLSLGVSDETGAATFHLWESEFLKLIAETAYELNMVGELEELPRGAIESLGNKEALFKVLVEEGQTKKFTGAYSVTQVKSDADEIEKFRKRKNQIRF